MSQQFGFSSDETFGQLLGGKGGPLSTWTHTPAQHAVLDTFFLRDRRSSLCSFCGITYTWQRQGCALRAGLCLLKDRAQHGSGGRGVWLELNLQFLRPGI